MKFWMNYPFKRETADCTNIWILFEPPASTLYFMLFTLLFFILLGVDSAETSSWRLACLHIGAEMLQKGFKKLFSVKICFNGLLGIGFLQSRKWTEVFSTINLTALCFAKASRLEHIFWWWTQNVLFCASVCLHILALFVMACFELWI